MNNHPVYDVIIVGGGLVGASVLLAIADLPIKILWLDSKDLYQTSSAADERALALSHGSSLLLQRLGILPATTTFTNIDSILVSEQGRFAKVLLTAHEMQLPALGYVMPIDQLQNALLAKLNALPKHNIAMLMPATVTQLAYSANTITITVNSATQQTQNISAKLLIAADGEHSTIRQALNLPATHNAPQELAIVAKISHSLPHNQRAFERFTPHGTIALLPLTTSYTSKLIWSMPLAAAQIYCDDPAALLAQLQQNFGHQLGKFTTISRLQNFPLNTVVSHNIVAQRAILLGNAARKLNPIAAQGFNLSLRDAWSLAEHLRLAHANQVDLGDANVLTDFAAQRAFDQNYITNFTQYLHTIFTSNKLSSKILRNLGMHCLAQSKILRTLLVGMVQ